MGRYSVHLSPQLADLAGVDAGQRVLDVGCGPGALTAELVGRLGADGRRGSRSLRVLRRGRRRAAPRGRRPAGVRRSSCPFADGEFDAALAQLVVHFMSDPVAGLAEMRRVTRAGGVVAACVWDHAGGKGPLSLFWHAARELDPDADDESELAGAAEVSSPSSSRPPGCRRSRRRRSTVAVEHPSFEDWWEPFTLGVGRRRLHRAARAGAAGAATRAVPRDTARGAVRARVAGVDGPRRRLSQRRAV